MGVGAEGCQGGGLGLEFVDVKGWAFDVVVRERRRGFRNGI